MDAQLTRTVKFGGSETFTPKTDADGGPLGSLP